MIRVRKFSSAIAAERAAAFLRDNGVPATVVGDHIHQAAGMLGMRFTQPEVVVPTEAMREKAERLLKTYDESPMVLGMPLEDAAAPDLSRLDAEEFAVECPECGERLALDAKLEACPECGAAVDVAGLIVERYGPEALEACYDLDPAPPDQQATRDLRPAMCPGCRFNLAGLPARGRCPECGRLYDKDVDEGRW